jgi:hypothetical protein
MQPHSDRYAPCLPSRPIFRSAECGFGPFIDPGKSRQRLTVSQCARRLLNVDVCLRRRGRLVSFQVVPVMEQIRAEFAKCKTAVVID